ncbi:TonB-dependent receptor [Sphingomonas sp. Leaf412]|uniref:TonB-dependent receptor plug domain-containing protein n=1 Tax=Sphingomonas sp. Leaf412 TaxID=1736370 RepID=UPI0006F75917|nr:TonB-dependent receptor [Sphingomonas sp. Leaf412]KQT32091.1 TonB-dependent receptor [Sphingomonas sp. Leaf412]
MKTIVSLLALIATTPSLAQSNPTLPTTDEAGNAIVVTGSRSGEATEVRNLPASITLLGPDDLAERQTRIVSDILRDVPGLAVSRTGAVGGMTQVRIRGSEANHVLVLIDGIEVSDPYQGEFDFGTLIADEAAKIEVLRGQQSSLYGSDAIGGVIQYITLTGREAPGLSLRAEGGSFGTFAGGARAAGAGDTVDYALSTSLYRTDGTPTARGGSRDIGSTSIGATAKATWTPSDVFTLTGVGRYSHVDALSNDTQGNPVSPNFGLPIDSPGVKVRNEAFYGLARAQLALADGRWVTAVTGQIADSDRRGFDGGERSFGNEGRRYKGSAETSLRFGSDRVVNRVTAAVDLEREVFRNTTPSPFAFQGRRATTNWGFVGQYELTVDDAFSAGASIRRDENSRFDDVTTWRAQAGYRLPFGLRARGAYGTGVKNPGYFELFGFSDGRYIGNPNLRPEKSRGWEAGADQEIAGGKATVGATYFDSVLEDEIFTTFAPPTFVATPANRTTRSRQHGVEVFGSATPIPQLKFDLAYTYLRARENGVEEVRRPRHVASLNTTVFGTDRRLSGTLTVRYNGRQTDVAFTDPSFRPVTVAMQDYVLVNLAADYRLTERLSLFGRVENLFSERYEEVFGFATPGAGGYAGIRARL